MRSRRISHWLQGVLRSAAVAAVAAIIPMSAHAAGPKFPTATVNTTGLAVTDDVVTVG
ncbi:MAG: hypothetical protein JWP03_2066, partial [Phycisphaerales bacterium]|nr:hypothetical protein [Phycisphaerales bacterium]